MNDDMNTALEWLVGLVLFPLLMLSNFIGYALGLPPQAGANPRLRIRIRQKRKRRK